MASTDARPVPRKNAAYRVYFPILDADGDPVTGATGLDSEVSIDGGAFSDCTNEATEIGSSGLYYLDLTSSEMNGDGVVVRVQTSSSGAKTSPLIFYPEESGDVRCDVVQISGSNVSTSTAQLGVNIVNAAGTAWNSGGITSSSFASGSITAASIAADAIGASELAADAASEIATAVWASVTRTLTGLGFTLAASDLATDTITAAKLASDAVAEIQSGLSTHSASDVWAVATRRLSDATNITSTGGTITVSAGAVTVGTNSDKSGYGLADGAITAAKFGSGAIDAAAFASDAANEVADAVLARSVSNVESSAAEHTLCTVVLAMLESSVSGSSWTIKRTNGSTTHATKTVTTNASADPITGVS